MSENSGEGLQQAEGCSFPEARGREKAVLGFEVSWNLPASVRLIPLV